MDGIQILNAQGDTIDPARVRITHESRVLDTTTRLRVAVSPKNALGLFYPLVEIDETPPVRCFLYDWLQYVNFKLQREFGNVITSKEQQTKTAQAFDIFPRRQASFVEVVTASWEPVYSTMPAETGELYLLLDRLINLPPVELEDQELITSFRVTADDDRRVTANGDVRVTVVNILPANLPEAA